MAFTNTVLERGINAGAFFERGTFASTGGSTGGTITPQYTGNGLNGGIRSIQTAIFGSDGNTNIAQNYSVGNATVTITTAANDTGEYYISGYGA